MNSFCFSLLLAFLLLCAIPASAQSNFSFWLGETAVSPGGGKGEWGTSVGANGKFNITDILLIRGQFNVDRAQLLNQVYPGFNGGQTVTFISLGAGPELAFGTRDYDIFFHLTPHGTIRSVSRIVTEGGTDRVWSLTRFSMGVLTGVGFEVFLSDNIGFELQGQYDVFNFDGSDTDPKYTGARGLAGVQFYLGRNFLR
ncbi:MAG: hypothetical protein ABI876_05135 [Bacteroidota bacterium]